MTKEPSMRGTGNGLRLAAVLVAVSVWPGVARRRLVHHRNRHLRREGAHPQAARDGRRPGVRQEAHGPRAERDAGPRQRQHHGQHHGLGLEGAAGRQDLARAQDAGGARSEWLHVHAARDGDHGRPALQDPQLRRRPPQHPHAAQGQPGVQQGRCRPTLKEATHDVRASRRRSSTSSATSTPG